jgi:hypothetical protein
MESLGPMANFTRLVSNRSLMHRADECRSRMLQIGLFIGLS